MTEVYHIRENKIIYFINYILHIFKLENKLSSYRFSRKTSKGTWYLIVNDITFPFWSRKRITSCNGRIITIEIYI